MSEAQRIWLETADLLQQMYVERALVNRAVKAHDASIIVLIAKAKQAQDPMAVDLEAIRAELPWMAFNDRELFDRLLG